MKILEKFFFVSLCLVFFMAIQAFANSPIYTSKFNNKALNGYDAVSYFTGDGQPVKGSKIFKTFWRDTNWLFSSQKNLDVFKADPEKYAPQYGGYCAWAIAHGGLAKGDPNVYHLKDGKIYLNYDESIQEKWLQHKDELIISANEKYSGLVEFE